MKIRAIWKKVAIPRNQTILNKICEHLKCTNCFILFWKFEDLNFCIYTFGYVHSRFASVRFSTIFLWFFYDMSLTFKWPLGMNEGRLRCFMNGNSRFFRNHVLWFPERWHHSNVYSHYAHYQSLKPSLLVSWRSDKGHNFCNR